MDLKWDQALPIALLQIWVAPISRLKLSPFEVVYGRPCQILVLEVSPSQIWSISQKLSNRCIF